MKRRHRFVAVSASTLGASILFGGALAPDAAATADCPDSSFCVWPETYYNGTSTTLTIPDFDGHCATVSATRSAKNETGQTVSLYDPFGTKIVTVYNTGVPDTVRAARYACLGDDASMNHNETVLD